MIKLHSTPTVDIFKLINKLEIEIPLITNGISAGFPSPAADFLDAGIDLNKALIKHPSTTFCGRVKGDSMKGLGIDNDDLMLIDKSLDAKHNCIAVCYIDGDFTVKQIRIDNKTVWLVPANAKYKPVQITKDNEFLIWGIVTTVIKSF